jgi:YfiH family protein
MKNLQTDFSLIKPTLIQEDEGVDAWFTQKNKHFETGNNIPGLNLGFNTPEKKEVIAQNRLKLLSRLGLNQDWVAYADQVHSTRIRAVSQGGIYPETDGLLTRIPGLTLAIQVADCAAILLWDAKNKVIGAVHAGWRGAAGNIVPQGIQKMTDLGADPSQVKAFVSPCISFKNFEVGKEVADLFPDEFVDLESHKKPHLNLKGFLRHQLQEGGLLMRNIEINNGCTIEEAKRFYSYRREGQQSGRMMALIHINE